MILHVQVLLGVLNVPFYVPVNVEVKFFGHGQRNQRRSLGVRCLTAVIKLQVRHREQIQQLYI